MGADFENGLFGCFGNCGLCIKTFFCPCIVFGQTAEKVGDSCCLCGGLIFIGACIPVCIERGKVRANRGIDGGTIGDLCVSWLCPFCAIIQMSREMDGISASGMSIARV